MPKVCCFTFAQRLTFRNPNNETDEYLKNVTWMSLESDKSNYLDIGNVDLKMKNGLYTERYALWEQLFPLN